MRHRRFVWLFVLVLGGLLVRQAVGQVVFNDPGFVSELVAQLDPWAPVGMTFAPDGRIFVWEKAGAVRIVKNGAVLGQPFLNISSQVNRSHDRGLLGLALDPEFDDNGHVYLLYTYESGPDPEDDGPKTARLTRVTANPANPDVAVAGSEVVILGSVGVPPCGAYPADADCIPSDGKSHTIGALQFAPDGKLFVSAGDGASYDGTDVLALRAQDLDSYAGKILRINKDGSAPGDNPFDDGTNSIRSRVYAYGLRNAYRFTLDPDGEPYLGNVGWYEYESVFRGRGANFGWPCYEGDRPQSGYQNDFQACRDLPSSAVTAPLYYYGHDEGVSVIGGPIYTGTEYPAQYHGNYFFGDFGGGWIRRIILAGDGSVQDVQEFATGLNGLVHLELGPDGRLYYIDLPTGQIRRIAVGQRPTAAASAAPASGYSPLAVTFSSAGSGDVAGGTLAFDWDFGDGSPHSAQANPTHVYTAVGVRAFTARLTVTTTTGPNAGLSASTDVRVVVNSTPPVPAILTPSAGATVVPGQVIEFVGRATDDDEPAAGLTLTWQILLYQGGLIEATTGATGPRGSLIVENPDPGAEGDAFYRLLLTATDSTGLQGTAEVTVTVDRQGLLALDPMAAGFGAVGVGAASAWQSVSVLNTSGINLTLGRLTLGGVQPKDFQTQSDGCSKKRLLPGQACTVRVRFRPTDDGARSATMAVPVSAPGVGPFQVGLGGTGVPGDVEASPGTVAFDPVGVGRSFARTVEVGNAGPGKLKLGQLALGGDAPEHFRKEADDCSATTLAGGASCTVRVRFKPKAPGAHEAELTVPSDDPDEPTLAIALGGTGLPGDVEALPAALDFEDVRVRRSVTRPVEIRNAGPGKLSLGQVTLGGANASEFRITEDDCSGRGLKTGGSCTVKVQLRPTGTGERTAALSVPSDDPDEPLLPVPLEGTGTP